MDQSLQLFSENLLHMMRGALMMMFITMCLSLYPRRKESSILNYLFWLFVIMPAFLFLSFGFMIEELRDDERFNIFNILIDLCLIPLIGSFLLKIIMPELINKRKIILLLTPTVIFVIIYTITHNSLMLTFSFIYTALVALVIFVLIVFISIRYDRFLKNNFSNIDNKTVGWVRVVIFVFASWYLIWSIIVKYDSRWLDSAYYVFLITIWIFIYKYSIRHVAVSQAEELFTSPKQEDTNLLQSETVNKKLGYNLEQYMNQGLPWLNPSLSLQDLAIVLNTNRTYLSEYFHKTLNTTFYDYINSFRLEYACKILLSQPDLSILQVGEMSGFNSLSTFRRAFQRQIGCTPAKYRRQNIDI
ncbi:helix-turn-helix domain-containing protein [Prevotella sp. 10(H)]|uniref:AraC family transcriptional regulator n=1 Tax=Prevotella sp. 10(H) TaxID=1158294 RepID=UPI0004A77D8E|nr:helix-turn-helix domain-containing protein [Prevotella sp. 10(H)]